jgi:hydroxyethylthiazole kinase-like uncharacterized protein yjeF
MTGSPIKHVLTAAEMGAVDQRTESEAKIPLDQLMDRAGESVARFCQRHHPTAEKIAVLCGKGNNGGDGLVAARYLSESSTSVTVILLGAESELKGLPAEVLLKLRKANPAAILFCPDEPSLQEQSPVIEQADLLIDAVFGTGFHPPMRGLAIAAKDLVNRLTIPVVAVDLPSGWDADSLQQQAEDVFRANAVVTFTAPKLAHVFGHLAEPSQPSYSTETKEIFGPVVVADIGSPQTIVETAATQSLTWTGAAKSLAETPRDVNGNKGKFGHVLLVGGSYGTFGAPSMSSLAALRTGAGLVTAAVPHTIMNQVGLITPELMVRALEESQAPESLGTASITNLDETKLQPLMKGITVLAVGPGLSTRGESSEFARGLVATTTLPIVIDADALNAFAGKTELLKGAALIGGPGGGKRTIVLTPHPGEMGRLANLTVKEVEADRIGLARKFATEHQVTLVLKGWRTLVAHPDGRIAVNTTGNPAMAKGGSGDILTGIVAAMLSQYPNDVAEAVEAAVYLHGLAGDFAARQMDEHTVLATDTLAHLTKAFRYRVRDRDGFTWIAGLQPAARETQGAQA